MLSQTEIGSFVADGYVAVRDALPASVLRACQDEIWSALDDRGVRRDDPSGWHIEASFEQNGDWWVNYRSRGRGLLALYLFSDVDAASAPTRVRPGSHRDAARSWSTPRRGRTPAGGRGSWPSPASPCTTRSPWSRR